MRRGGFRSLEPLEAESVVKRLLADGVEAIAICLLNSFANPVHELMLKEVVERLVQPHRVHEFRGPAGDQEYERTSTTVINACLKPVVKRYLGSLRGTRPIADRRQCSWCSRTA